MGGIGQISLKLAHSLARRQSINVEPKWLSGRTSIDYHYDQPGVLRVFVS